MFDADRAKVLLQAMCDMMGQMERSYAEDVNIFEATAVWDEAECDGYCLYEEAKQLLGIEG